MNLSLTDNKQFLEIESCTELEYAQLKSSLTKKIDSWRFHPLVKKGVWNGEISFIKTNKIPSGLWKEVVDICKEYDFKLSMNGITRLFDNDLTLDEFTIWVNDFFKDSTIKPYDYQVDAAFKILRYRRCLAELATSAGKTLINFMVVAYILEVSQRKRILMIVPNVSLVIQATGDFEAYNKNRVQLKIQQIYAGVDIRKSSNVVIGTYQSLSKYDSSYFEQFDVVFVDECHQANAQSIQKIMDMCWHCDYRFGVSGTIPKKGTVNKLGLMSALGPQVVKVKANYLQENNYIANCEVLQLLLKYATPEQIDAFIKVSNVTSAKKEPQLLFNLERDFIIENEKRLNFVCRLINKSEKNSLVLFHKIKHGEKLYKKLKEISSKNIYYVDGGINANLREEFKSRMEDNASVEYVIFELDEFEAHVPATHEIKLSDGTFKLASQVTIDDDVDETFLQTYKK